jgi:hypothetical protein
MSNISAVTWVGLGHITVGDGGGVPGWGPGVGLGGGVGGEER